jgi:hypothetical protein
MVPPVLLWHGVWPADIVISIWICSLHFLCSLLHCKGINAGNLDCKWWIWQFFKSRRRSRLGPILIDCRQLFRVHIVFKTLVQSNASDVSSEMDPCGESWARFRHQRVENASHRLFTSYEQTREPISLLYILLIILYQYWSRLVPESTLENVRINSFLRCRFQGREPQDTDACPIAKSCANKDTPSIENSLHWYQQSFGKESLILLIMVRNAEPAAAFDKAFDILLTQSHHQ